MCLDRRHIDTGGTIVSAAELLLERGATEVWAMANHGVPQGRRRAPQRITLERLVLTNTLPLPEQKRLSQVEVLSIAPPSLKPCRGIRRYEVSEIFSGENYA